MFYFFRKKDKLKIVQYLSQFWMEFSLIQVMHSDQLVIHPHHVPGHPHHC